MFDRGSVKYTNLLCQSGVDILVSRSVNNFIFSSFSGAAGIKRTPSDAQLSCASICMTYKVADRV